LCGLAALGNPAAIPAMEKLLADSAVLGGEGTVAARAAEGIAALSRKWRVRNHKRP
jgi:hypothetical protein